ncbi:MAG: tetratricopeptide repeat protein, partial [Xanthomonadales bacterium]|nr:tetratricopeptide repeat protein [Xanthomonadales bacterium]
GVAVAVLAIAAMAFGLGIAVWQARLARAEAARADAQSARATRIAEFLTGLVREQDPLRRDRAQARSARELVGEGVLRARSEFADVSDLRASMLGVLGEAMTGLGELEQGRRLLEEARASLPDGSGEAARLDGLLGGIAIDQGRQVEGKALLDAALATLRAGSADDRRAAARIAVRRAFVQHNEGKPEAALAELRAAGSELNEVLGADHPDSLEVETGILAILSQMRRDDEAAPLADALVARIERVGGDHSARLIDPLNYAAQIAKRRADFARSRTLFERAIALAREHKGERNETLAGLYSRIANLQQEAGHADEALASLDAAARALPAGANLERAQMLATRGDILVDLGRFGEAEPALREALRLRRESSGDGDGQVWYSQSEWARALNGLGRHAEALAAQREALARMQSIMGGQAYQLTFVLRALAETCEAIGRVDESARLFARAAELAGARYGPFHTVTLQYRTSLASALRHSGDAAGALAEADAILARRDGHAELGVHLARAALIKARVLDGRGEHLAARALARQGLGDLDAAPVDNADTRRDLLELAGPRH